LLSIGRNTLLLQRDNCGIFPVPDVNGREVVWISGFAAALTRIPIRKPDEERLPVF
jgi:hypothetical protein